MLTSILIHRAVDTVQTALHQYRDPFSFLQLHNYLWKLKKEGLGWWIVLRLFIKHIKTNYSVLKFNGSQFIMRRLIISHMRHVFLYWQFNTKSLFNRGNGNKNIERSAIWTTHFAENELFFTSTWSKRFVQNICVYKLIFLTQHVWCHAAISDMLSLSMLMLVVCCVQRYFHYLWKLYIKDEHYSYGGIKVHLKGCANCHFHIKVCWHTVIFLHLHLSIRVFKD